VQSLVKTSIYIYMYSIDRIQIQVRITSFLNVPAYKYTVNNIYLQLQYIFAGGPDNLIMSDSASMTSASCRTLQLTVL